jgi:predicted dehydrogenase
MKTGQLDLSLVTTRRLPFGDALQVYSELNQAGYAEIGVVLEYEGQENPKSQIRSPKAKLEGVAEAKNPRAVERVHVLGAGNFARTMLLPHLKDRFVLGTVVNGTGLSAAHVKSKFGFAEAGTDANAVFGDSRCAVVIATRHHLHAPYVLRGLQADQHVFVEKPLCLTEAELDEIDLAMGRTRGSVMVGFNRRFAPATVAARKLLAGTAGPCSITYQVFAGRMPKDHWYANQEESGGRIIGEACHFFDFFCCLINSRPVSVSAQPVGSGNAYDTLSAQVAFADGSTAQLLYTASGDEAFPKETWRVFGGGLVIDCENFLKLTTYHRRKRQNQSFTSKGHAEEMVAWRDFLIGNVAHPLPYAAARQSMGLTFAALRAARENTTLHLNTL